jgi:hypothetical protein
LANDCIARLLAHHPFGVFAMHVLPSYGLNAGIVRYASDIGEETLADDSEKVGGVDCELAPQLQLPALLPRYTCGSKFHLTGLISSGGVLKLLPGSSLSIVDDWPLEDAGIFV